MSRKRPSIRRPSEARRSNHPQRAKSGKRSASSISRSQRQNKPASSPADRSVRSQDTRSNLLHIASDMRRAEARGEKLTFSRAARERGVDPRSRHSHVTALFYKDSSGRIHARKSDNYAQKFSLPTTRPDVFDSVTARGSAERSLVGRWLNTLKAAGDGDFTPLQNFPKNIFVDGKRLPTAPYEVQKILEAVEQGKEDAFEQMYYGRGAR